MKTALLLLLGGSLFFVALDNRDLLSSHEARAAQDAQMIVSDGVWGLPRLFDGHVEMQKPPLYYWLVALLGILMGGEVNPWAVRLPAATAALGCVLLVYYLGRKCGRSRAGFLAALILATSLHFTWMARVGRIDMPLTFAVTLAGAGFYLGMLASAQLQRAWPRFLLAYVSIALGILLKGPIALVLALAIMGTFVLVQWPRQQAGRLHARTLLVSMLWGIPLVILIAAPWFIWANIRTHNQLWEVFFLYHNLERGLGGADTLASHPVWFYFPRLVIDFLPWSLAVPAAVWYFWRRGDWSRDREALFGAAWFAGVFVLLSAMSFKRADYLLPAYPGFALFMGCVIDNYWQRQTAHAGMSGNWQRLQVLGFGAVLACYLLGWGVFNLWITPRQERGWPYYQLARQIREQTTMPVIFFRAESHVLAFHMGRPLDTILEWENLEIWANLKEPIYFVMPPDCAQEWSGHLTRGRLEEVYRTSDYPWGKHDRPLVVMRSCP